MLGAHCSVRSFRGSRQEMVNGERIVRHLFITECDAYILVIKVMSHRGRIIEAFAVAEAS